MFTFIFVCLGACSCLPRTPKVKVLECIGGMWRHVLYWLKIRSISRKRSQLKRELDAILDQLKALGLSQFDAPSDTLFVRN
jgi:hypothetical protein